MTRAAAYGFGIAKAHAFIDGNKRTAFVVMATFLLAHQRGRVERFLRLAGGP